jgi:hypothetical protein
MARYDTFTCKTCGKVYEFCLKCQVARPDYDAEHFCCKDHADIYAILSKNGCNLITAEETLKELSAYNLDEITLTESVLAHIEKLKAEVPAKVEEPVEARSVEIKAEEPATPVEAKPVFKSNKKNKKKW